MKRLFLIISFFALCNSLFSKTNKNATEKINNTMPVSVSVTDIIPASCNGACDGSALVTFSGAGTGPYTITWTSTTLTTFNNVVTSPFQCTGLCAGNYVVRVFGTLTTQVANITIPQPAPLNVFTNNLINVSCNGLNDGAANIFVSGGTSPYNIQWNDPLGQTGFSINSLSAGLYTAAVTDANGCVLSHNVNITEPTQISSSIDTIHTSSLSNCDGSATANVTGGNPNYYYTWLDPSLGVIGTGQTISGLCVGTYTLNVTDNNACLLSSVFPIHVETIGIKEIQTLNACIFPNPTTEGSFIIQLNDANYKNLHFNMYNASGARVMDKNLPSQPVTEITTSGLTAGIYFYQLINAEGKKYSGKIAIRN